MFCPLCGHKLIEIKRENEEDYSEELLDVWVSSDPDQSTWFKCDNCKSFGNDYPLIMHDPFGGHKSEPGDSWSLTWLK